MHIVCIHVILQRLAIFSFSHSDNTHLNWFKLENCTIPINLVYKSVRSTPYSFTVSSCECMCDLKNKNLFFWRKIEDKQAWNRKKIYYIYMCGWCGCLLLATFWAKRCIFLEKIEFRYCVLCSTVERVVVEESEKKIDDDDRHHQYFFLLLLFSVGSCTNQWFHS